MTIYPATTTLPCGCPLGFLDDLKERGADLDDFLVHQKPWPLARAYRELRESFRGRPPAPLLEIGVARGGSIAFWRSMGWEGRIVGVDVEPALTRRAKLHFAEHDPEVVIVRGDAASDAVDDLARAVQFAMIVDDGSHRFEDIVGAHRRLWPRLTAGGLYVVEDWFALDARPGELIAELTRPMVEDYTRQEPDPRAPYRAMVWKNMIVMEKP